MCFRATPVKDDIDQFIPRELYHEPRQDQQKLTGNLNLDQKISNQQIHENRRLLY